MSINWKRVSKTHVEGYVGDVLCFHLIVEGNQLQLICELPEATPGTYGRWIGHFKTAKAATTHAAKLLKHWTERFEK